MTNPRLNGPYLRLRADLALAPFALALGLDLFVTAGRIFGETGGAVAGITATVLAIASELTIQDHVLRYRVEQTDDGFDEQEGCFTICSFWLVSALAEIGETKRARDLCEKLLSHASPLNLYAEQIDPHSGRHLGNFPQAFTHLALINAVMHVIRDEEAAMARPYTGVTANGIAQAAGQPANERSD